MYIHGLVYVYTHASLCYMLSTTCHGNFFKFVSNKTETALLVCVIHTSKFVLINRGNEINPLAVHISLLVLTAFESLTSLNFIPFNFSIFYYKLKINRNEMLKPNKM